MDTYLPNQFALTGATGALGFAFLRRCFQQHPALRASLLVRRSSAAFQAAPFQAWLRRNETRLTLIEGDLRSVSPETLDPLLQTDGGLWHFAALTELTANDDAVAREIHAVNVEGTQRLLDAEVARRGPSPFFHISTAYVAGDRHGLVREDESDLGQQHRNPYEASKLAAETLVQRAFSAGMIGAIFRPSLVVDDMGGTGGLKIIDACAYSVGLATKRGEPIIFRFPATASINLVHSDWVIAAMVDLARLPSGSGWTYHLTTPHSTSFGEIAELLRGIVPNLQISFEPGLTRAELPPASRVADKAMNEFLHYLSSGIEFDRTNTERDLSATITETPLDLPAFVQSRLQAELERVAHRQVNRANRPVSQVG